jgi:hypothetical protein
MAFLKRKRLIVAGTTLALIGGVVAYVFWPQSDELTRWKAQMRARGEKFSLAEVAPKFSQEKFDWGKQIQTVVAGIKTQPVPLGAVGMMVSATPGYAVPAWQRPFANETPETNHTWAALEEQMARSADELHQLQELLRHIPAGSLTDYSDPIRLPAGINFYELRTAAQGMSLAVVNDLHQGSLPSALTNLHALIALTQAQAEDGEWTDQMVRSGIASLGTAATWEALQASGWGDAQLAALEADWARVELVKGIVPAFEFERARTSELYQYARTNRGGARPFFVGPTRDAKEFFNDWFYAPLWQKAWSKKDELLYHRAMQPIGEACRDAATNRSWHRLPETVHAVANSAFYKSTTLDQFRYQFFASSYPNLTHTSLKKLLLRESQIQMARAAIAIERHRLRHGRTPESLAKLLPEFLRDMPVDFMTGRPLLYAVNLDGSFALYSAGEDGLDDDGLGDDAVWPQANLPACVTAPRPGERISLVCFQDDPPRDAITKLAGQVGLEVRYQPKAAEKLWASFPLTLTNVTAAAALEAAFEHLGLALVRGPKHTNYCVVVNPFPARDRQEGTTQPRTTIRHD